MSAKKYIPFLLLFFLAHALSAQPGFISTIAGDRVAGYNGDGIAATAAELNDPIDAAPDKYGNVYISDNFNHRIRIVDTNGVITTFAGNGTGGYSGDSGAATNAELFFPCGIIVDDTGNVYFTDVIDDVVRKINTKGIIYTVAGGGSSGLGDGGQATDAELGGPRWVIIDTAGNMYIADQDNARVRKVNKQGIISTIAGNGTDGYSGDNGPATDAELDVPSALTEDIYGNIYIADVWNNMIRKVDTNGIITTFAGNGTPGSSGDGGPATDAEVYTPDGLATDNSGNIYIGDENSNRIRVVGVNDTITTVARTGITGWSGDGGPATNAELSSAIGVSLDDSGNIYITENLDGTGNNDVRKVVASCISTVPVLPGLTLLCTGQSVLLTASGFGSYTWSPSTGLSATTGSSVTANPTLSVTYTVTGTNSTGCSATGIEPVNVIPSPNTPTFHQHGDTLISSSVHDNQWYRNDSVLTNDTSQYLIIAALGEYWVVVNNEVNGCSTSSDSINITTLTGIEQLSMNNNQLSVYPNPVSEQLTVISNQSTIDEIEITDVLGQMVFVSLGNLGNKNTIDMSGFPSGMYFITVITEMGRKVVKVVKQ